MGTIWVGTTGNFLQECWSLSNCVVLPPHTAAKETDTRAGNEDQCHLELEATSAGLSNEGELCPFRATGPVSSGKAPDRCGQRLIWNQRPLTKWTLTLLVINPPEGPTNGRTTGPKGCHRRRGCHRKRAYNFSRRPL